MQFPGVLNLYFRNRFPSAPTATRCFKVLDCIENNIRVKQKTPGVNAPLDFTDNSLYERQVQIYFKHIDFQLDFGANIILNLDPVHICISVIQWL